MVESAKWIDDIVKLHRIGLIPLKEFDDDNVGTDNDDNKLVYWKETGKRVLIKKIQNNLIVDKETEKYFYRELKLHLRRDVNERIIQIFGVSQELTTDSFSFVIQYADGGNLQNSLENLTKLSWIDKFNLAYQISEGLNFLHSAGIIHGNLYPWNIVFHQNHAKLTNFGMQNHFTVKNSSSSHDDFPIKIIPYIEPKLLLDQSYKKDARSDIYSLGVIMWEISSGSPPYNNDLNKNDLITIILENKRPEIVTNTPKTYSDLYSECWSDDPSKRPAIKIVLSRLNTSMVAMKAGSESSERMLEQDKEFRDLEIDAMTAELWLGAVEEKKEFLQKSTPADIEIEDKDDDENSLEKALESPIEETEKSREVKLMTNESGLSRKASKKSWKKKAKGFVKRLSRGSSDLSGYVKKSPAKTLSVDGKDLVGHNGQLEGGWTMVTTDDGLDTLNNEQPESPRSNKGFFSSLKRRSTSEGSLGKSASSLSTSIITLQPDKFPYSEHCKKLFATNRWTINSAPCYAAYHVRQGDIDGLKWHVQVQKEGLNELQQVTGPRNSYRRPLEPLMIEAAQYCPGEKIIKTFTALQSLGATCDCTNSYTGGSPINYLGENRSLFSSETNSQYFKDSLMFLISNGCLINTRKQNGDTLLITLLFKWYKELTPNVIKFCLDHEANPDISNEIGGNSLSYTLTQVRFNYVGGPFEKIYKILKLLVKYGADVNKQITIPGKNLPNLLFVCVDMGINMREEWIKKLIKRLIKWGVNVNARIGEVQEQEEKEEEIIYNYNNDDDDDIIMLAETSKIESKVTVTFNLTDDQKDKEKELSKKMYNKESLSVLSYAAKLSQLSTIKILLDRIYSLSTPESIQDALDMTSSEEVEQKKYLKSWLGESGKEKRNKVKIRLEKRELKRREKLKKIVKKGKQTEIYDGGDDDHDGDHDNTGRTILSAD